MPFYARRVPRSVVPLLALILAGACSGTSHTRVGASRPPPAGATTTASPPRPGSCPPGSAPVQRSSGPDLRACVALELASTTIRSGSAVGGTLSVVNRAAQPLTYTQPDACATTRELRRGGRHVGGGAQACAQIFVGEVTLRPQEAKRLPVSFQAIDEGTGGPLAPGRYDAVAALHTASADGTWAAPPVAITVTS